MKIDRRTFCLGVTSSVVAIATATKASVGSASAASTAVGSAAVGPASRHASAASTPTGTLRYGVYSDTPSLDPRLLSSTLSTYAAPAYDTLIALDENWEPQPWLATAWEHVDEVTWQLTLRDDVTFHDGTAFDAEAVKANFDAARTLDGSPSASVYQRITEVTVVDPTTVTITLSAPSPTFLYDMSRPTGAMISPAAIDEDADLTRASAGSGGWIYDAGASQEGSRHVWTANPDYWNPDVVLVERVEMHIIQDGNARLNAAESGDVEISNNLPPALRSSIRDAGLTIADISINSANLFITDRGGELVPALADPNVRRAIGLLIDRDAYNTAILSGEGDASYGGFLPPDSAWFEPSLNDLARYDVDEAKQLLADAGYADGFTLQLPIVPAIQRNMEAVAQLLSEGNITLELVTVPDGTIAAAMRAGDYPISYGNSAHVDPSTWYDEFVSSTGPYNPFGLDDVADLDDLAAQGASAADDERKAIYDEIQTQVIERGIVITLSYFPATAAVTDTVQGDVRLLPQEYHPRPHGLSVEE